MQVVSREPPTLRELFLSFLRIALSGVGGVMPHAHHTLVARKRWFDDREFTEILSAGQFLPGPNIVNVGVLVGVRMRGLPGALAAFAGLVTLPFLLVLALSVVYESYAGLPWVAHAFRGFSCGAAGLVVAMAIKLGTAQPRRLWLAAIAASAFVAVAVLHLPLVAVVLVLAPLGLIIAWRSHR
jgi:chromate transporter